jgi:heterodisulfide reductase subunit A
MIQQKHMKLEPIKATVHAEQCSGCRICNTMCPYNAISFDDAKGVSGINAAMCQGCGTCVAACPAGAIAGTGFSDEQVLAQIEGLLSVGADGTPLKRSAYPVAHHQGDGNRPTPTDVRSSSIEETVRA